MQINAVRAAAFVVGRLSAPSTHGRAPLNLGFEACVVQSAYAVGHGVDPELYVYRAAQLWISLSMLSKADMLNRLILIGLLTYRAYAAGPPRQPSIAFVVIDDLGFDDTSLHGSTQIPTPTLSSLAKEGVLLNNYYVMPVCTPTRSAIHTGRHPIHTGMQGGALLGQQRLGLPLGIVTLPQQLKKLGYSCYATGKWVKAQSSFLAQPQARVVLTVPTCCVDSVSI